MEGIFLNNLKDYLEESKRINNCLDVLYLNTYGLKYNNYIKYIITGISPLSVSKKINLARTTKGTGSGVRGATTTGGGPKRKNLENKHYSFISKFPFEMLYTIKPDVKFKKIYSLEFNNIMEGNNEIIYNEYKSKYYLQKEDNELDKVNYILQRISSILKETGIKNNDIYYEGYLPIKLSIIVMNYVNKNEIYLDNYYLNSKKFIEENNKELMYYIWLIQQVFIFKNHYCNLLDDDNNIIEWFAYGKLMRRNSDKGFRSKGQIYANIDDVIIKNKIKYYEGKQINEK